MKEGKVESEGEFLPLFQAFTCPEGDITNQKVSQPSCMKKVNQKVSQPSWTKKVNQKGISHRRG